MTPARKRTPPRAKQTAKKKKTTKTAGRGKSLAGRVAVVCGATRGAGRGIARGLGERCATVYCTGRSVRGSPSPYERPETIEETAELVERAGGTGIAVRVDHTVEDEVHALFARVAKESGRLDVLVNSVAGEDPLMAGWGTPLWKTDLTHMETALRQALLSHIITTKHAIPLMMKGKRGLIVEVTEGDLPGGSGGNVMKDVSKAALKDFATRTAEELYDHGIASLAVTPGFLRSETMLEHFDVTEETWRDGGKKDEHFLQSETPLFIGRAVAALAADPNVFARTGELTSSWELARAYEFDDADGSRPDWGRHFQRILPSLDWLYPAVQRQAARLRRMTERAETYVSPIES